MDFFKVFFQRFDKKVSEQIFCRIFSTHIFQPNINSHVTSSFANTKPLRQWTD